MWLLAHKPALYILMLLCTVLGAITYKLRTDTIFGCPADGYEPDQYLAYCHAADYGDYDRGAFWFDLEPDARRMAVDAEVLILGSSRMQFAFSTSATDKWFSAAAGVTTSWALPRPRMPCLLRRSLPL